jgi:hypothetical protein
MVGMVSASGHRDLLLESMTPAGWNGGGSGINDWGNTVNYLVAALRLLVGAAGLVSILATFFDTASRAVINPFNFFGFFTMQNNIVYMVVILLTAVVGFSGRAQSTTFQVIRGCATSYIVIVGLVYNTLLAGLEGGISLEWANWVLHVAVPVYAAIDWILFGDRSALPWKLIWIVLVYPAVWLAVVLIRGATDGWVPYPFLDPAQGYGVVAGYSLTILAAILVVAAGVWAISRVRIIKLSESTSAQAESLQPS